MNIYAMSGIFFDNRQRISIKLEYDKVGREALRKFGNGTSEQTLYDKAGRVTVKTQKNARGDLLWGEGYVYGSDGKRTATVDNLGRITFYEYNSKGQLSSVYYPYTQEMINTLKEEAEANGLTTTAEAGENRFITNTERAELVPLMNSMQYGLAYNLTSLQIFIKESYAYDKNGNRTTKTTPYGKIEYTYDRENCLLSSGSKGQTFINYTYDAMGNLLTEESANKTVKYAYNAQNRLIYCEVTDRANKEYAQTTYAYDAFGRRIIVQDRGEAAIRTLYDGLTFDIIKQGPTFANGQFTDSGSGIKFSSTGRPTGDRYRYLGDEDKKDGSRYFYLDEGTYKNVSTRYRGERTTINVNGTLAAQTTTEGTDYFSTDLLGSIRSTTDVYGAQKSNYTYDAFGSLIQGRLNGTTDHGYLGKQHDTTSRLYNYGYRDYKPQTARFTTLDPIRDGHNWFSYCNGDPINFVDLWGLEASDIVAIETLVVILRENDGYSDSFNSDRYIYKDYGNGRQLVYHDRVTANARSEAFAKEHDGFTEPDGVYGYTFEGGSLVKQADGTYNSNKFKNVIRHTTNDPNIPEDIREKINTGDFYDHANQFKDKDKPYNSGQNPGSAGCTIGSGGQAHHDEYMEILMQGVEDVSTMKRVIHSYSNGLK